MNILPTVNASYKAGDIFVVKATRPPTWSYLPFEMGWDILVVVSGELIDPKYTELYPRISVILSNGHLAETSIFHLQERYTKVT